MNGKKELLTGNNGGRFSSRGHTFVFIKSLLSFCPRWVDGVRLVNNSYVEIFLRNSDFLFPFFSLLKTSSMFRFGSLMDLCGVDYPDRGHQRFEVVYSVLSLKNNIRFVVKARTSEDRAISSLLPLYPSAGWLERETWDMYGIFFSSHSDLRRILTDYGFEGFPLRKDFPTIGYFEVRYDEETKKIVSEPVETTQEYRLFDFSNPWNQRIGSL